MKGVRRELKGVEGAGLKARGWAERDAGKSP